MNTNLGKTEDLPDELREAVKDWQNGFKDPLLLPILRDNKWGFEPGWYKQCNEDWVLVRTGRRFLGKPLRAMSVEYHGSKLSLDEFYTEMYEAIEGYRDNMEHLARDNHQYFANHSHYMEEWMESFLAWFELEQDS